MARKFNILEHELVPSHKILTLRDALRVLKMLRAKPENLPWLRENDPVARAIKAKPGDIVMIERKSHTAKKSIAFRYVVTG